LCCCRLTRSDEPALSISGSLILMNAWFRRMLEPAQTSPTDSFAWSDKRSKRKQVANGFRIAGGLIAGFVVIVAVVAGFSRLSEDRLTQSGSSILVSWTPLVFGAVIMLWTANRWAPFVTGFFFGPAAIKILATLVLEQDSYYSAHSITRTGLAEFLTVSLAVIALTSRFVVKTRHRPRFSTACPDVLCVRVSQRGNCSISVSLLVFTFWRLALFAAWCVHRFTRVKLKRRHHVHDPEAPMTSVEP